MREAVFKKTLPGNLSRGSMPRCLSPIIRQSARVELYIVLKTFKLDIYLAYAGKYWVKLCNYDAMLRGSVLPRPW